MAKVSYHGFLGAALIPSICMTFLAVIVIEKDNIAFSRNMGSALAALGLLYALAGFVFNKKAPRISRPKSRFAAPHLLAELRVQYWGAVLVVSGLAMAASYYL